VPFLACLSLAVPFAEPAAQAGSPVVLAPESTQVMGSSLPTGRSSASAAYDGHYVYLFGGFDGSLSNAILRYDPVADRFTTMAATLPTGRSATSAVSDGRYAYVFGGVDATLVDKIVRYDPQADAVTTLAAALPTGRSETAAVWTGSVAYIFGGFGGTLLDQIVRFNPATGEVAVMGAHLPSGRSGPSAVWDGRYAYVFGGGQDGNQIVRYDPPADLATVMNAKLPTARYRTAATWDGRFAYIFGGNDGAALNQIVRYDPQEDLSTLLGLTLPYGRSEAAAASVGYSSYVFAGCCNGASLLDDVVGLTSANAFPVPAFSAQRNGLLVTVDAASAADPDGSLVAYAWDWGDGSEPGHGAQASHHYAAAGAKLITLTVTDNRGLEAGIDLEVPVLAAVSGAVSPPPFLTIPRPSPTGTQDPGAPDAAPSEGALDSDDGTVAGDDRAGDAAAPRAPEGFASRLAHALGESWSHTPGLWIGLTLTLGTACAVAAVFLFRFSARQGPSRKGPTMGPPRPPVGP
jgi:PKD domain-containing protein/Kelch motif protein